MTIDNYTPTQRDWDRVKRSMDRYNRKSGYIDVIEFNNGKLGFEFFDSDPFINNCSAWFVTRDEIEFYSKQ